MKASLYWLESGLLDSIGRKRLCNLIISNELSVDINARVSSARLQELAYEITIYLRKNGPQFTLYHICPMDLVLKKQQKASF